MKINKTNAMRLLDTHHIEYQVHTYPHHNEAVDGLAVAKSLNQDPSMVFKTLICRANTKELLVFMVSVDHELDLKKAAKAAKVKSCEMIAVKEINAVSGYVRGGCSPLAMKKEYRTFIDESAILYDDIYFSAGKIGMQIQMNPNQLSTIIPITFIDLVK